MIEPFSSPRRRRPVLSPSSPGSTTPTPSRRPRDDSGSVSSPSHAPSGSRWTRSRSSPKRLRRSRLGGAGLIGQHPSPEALRSPDTGPEAFELDNLAVVDEKVDFGPVVLDVPREDGRIG